MTPGPICDIYDHGLLSPDHRDTTNPVSTTNASAKFSVSRPSLKAASAQVENLIFADSHTGPQTKRIKIEILKLEEDATCMSLGE
jgi:hypothetical protein